MKIFFALTLTLCLLFVASPVMGEELAQEGSVMLTNMWGGTHQMMPLNKEHFVLSYDNTGVLVSESGETPFNYMSTRNVGVICYDRGIGKTSGYILMTDPKGDKILVGINEDKAKSAPNPSVGIGEILEGTGKFAGITGKMEYTRWGMQPASEESHQGMAKLKLTWQMPEKQTE